MRATPEQIAERRAAVVRMMGEGLRAKQVAYALGVSTCTVLADARAAELRVHGGRLRNLTEGFVRERFAAGASLSGVAAEVGCTRQAIYFRIRRGGWGVR